MRDSADVPSAAFGDAFKARYKEDWSFHAARNTMRMFTRAVNDAKSAEPLRVAKALEGLRIPRDTGELWMRPEDHQVVHALYVATFITVGAGGIKHDWEATGYERRADERIEPKDTILPTTCRMERPAP